MTATTAEARPARKKKFASENTASLLKSAWNRMHKLPGGKLAFSKLLGRLVPYTGGMGAVIQELRPGYSRVTLTDRKSVRNHLNSVHAIALANLAELTGNIAVTYTMPEDARFIVSGMEIVYLKKARGTITGLCNSPAIPDSQKREYKVDVRLQDDTGDIVARAMLTTLIGPVKSA